jgi:uncharacterized protein YcbK (DUF882 family)
MAMRRRALLLGAAAPAALAIGAAGPALAARREQPLRRLRGPPPRRLQLRHAHTGNRFSGPYHDGRTADPIAMADLSFVLADSRTGAMRPFDPFAIDVLWEVGQKAGATGEFLIFSGYRTPETNALVDGAGDSQHLRAAALDVFVPAERLAAFGEVALRLGLGGVGIYAERGFVHLDSGPVRRWGDIPADVPMVVVAARPAQRPARPDPLARMAEAWAATRGR